MRPSIVGLIVLAVCLSTASALQAAQTVQPSTPPTAIPIGTPLKFHCQWTKRFSQGIPWTGDLTIKDNAEGIINGTYRSTSLKPDPFYGKIVTVTGAVNGTNIRLSFGIVPSLTVLGQLVKGGITGTTPYNGGTLEFAAALAH